MDVLIQSFMKLFEQFVDNNEVLFRSNFTVSGRKFVARFNVMRLSSVSSK